MTARRLQVCLGLLWLLDGALQLQPFMFTEGFSHQVIAAAAAGQPAFVSVPVEWAARLIGAHPVAWDALFAAVQLGIGAGLLWARTVRLAVAASVGWALGVWYLGEGLGGLAGGHASILTGAPGAVLVYAVLAALAWPAPNLPSERGGKRAWLLGGDSRRRPGPWAPAAWAVLWVGDAVLRMLPGQNTAAAMAMTISSNGAGAPGWLRSLDRAVAGGVHQGGPAVVGAVFAAEVAIGLAPLLGKRPRAAAGLVAVAVLAFMWLVGQSLGQIYTGQATDPNSAIPMIVLAVVVSAGGEPDRLAARQRGVTVRGTRPLLPRRTASA